MLNAILYILRSLFIALAFGLAFVKSGLFSPLKKSAAFLLGASSAPVVLAACGYILGLVFPGAPMWLFTLLPVALGLALLLIDRSYLLVWDGLRAICRGIKAYLEEIVHNSEKKRARNLFFRILAAVVFFCLYISLDSVSVAVQSHLIEADRSHYEVQARYFVEDRSSLGIDRYTGDREGTVLMDDHGGLWPVFIADAYMMDADHPEFWANEAVDCAYISTFYYMLLAVFALAVGITGKLRSGFPAVIFLLLYRYIGQFPFFGSRDGFRYIVLILLIALVYAHMQRIAFAADKRSVRLRWYDCLALAAACYCAMQGHAGNVYIMLGLFIAYGAFLLVARVRLKTILACALPVLGGTLLGMVKNIRVFFAYGDIRSTTGFALAGTPIIEQINAIDANRADMNRIMGTYTLFNKLLLALGAVSLLILLAVFVYRLCKRRQAFVEDDVYSQGMLFGVLALGMLLPLTGLFDIFGYRVSVWFLEQLRYRIYLFVLAAVLGGVCLTAISDTKRVWPRLLAWGVALLACLSVWFTMRSDTFAWPRYDAAVRTNQITGAIRDTAVQAAEIAGDGDVFVNEQILGFYFDRPAKLLFESYARPLLIAQTDEEIAAAITQLNARVFIFDSYGHHDFSLLPFYGYLQDPAHAAHIHVEGVMEFDADIYVVN